MTIGRAQPKVMGTERRSVADKRHLETEAALESVHLRRQRNDWGRYASAASEVHETESRSAKGRGPSLNSAGASTIHQLEIDNIRIQSGRHHLLHLAAVDGQERDRISGLPDRGCQWQQNDGREQDAPVDQEGPGVAQAEQPGQRTDRRPAGGRSAGRRRATPIAVIVEVIRSPRSDARSPRCPFSKACGP